jgi:hypothetical protein
VAKRNKTFRPPVGLDFYPDENGTGAERWLKGLREVGEAGLLALDALERLEAVGCEKGFLVYLLMQLHSTKRWNPVSRKTAQKALAHLRSVEPLLRELATSDLREELGLAEGPSEDGAGLFVADVQAIREHLEVAVFHATGRENQLFNDMMGHVVAYVRENTGQFHDDDLSAIIKLMGDGEFSCEGWRKRHWRATRHTAPARSRRKKQVHRVVGSSKKRP